MQQFLRIVFKTKRIFLLGLFLVQFVSAQNYQEVGDTLVNFGFEDGADSAGIPIGVILKNWDGTNGVFAIDDSIKKSGNYSGTMYDPDAGVNGKLDRAFDLPAGDYDYGGAYKVSLWIKTDLTEGTAQLIYEWDGSWANVDGIEGVTDWTEYVFYFQPKLPGSQKLRLHIKGTGQVWYDDVVVTKVEQRPNEWINADMELPDPYEPRLPHSWFAGWNPSVNTDSSHYYWDDKDANSGERSLRIPVGYYDMYPKNGGTPWIDAKWGNRSLWFKAGGVYEIEWHYKAVDMVEGQAIHFNLGYNNLDVSTHKHIGSSDGWVAVKDTIIFPTDQDKNGWRNEMRFRFYGPVEEGVWSEVFFDDVNVTYLGDQVPEPKITSVDDTTNVGEITISWEALAGVSSAKYYILAQPLPDENGNFGNNLVSNGGFEEFDADGSAPEGWSFGIPKAYANWSWLTDEGWIAAGFGEFPAQIEAFQGDMCVYAGLENPEAETGTICNWEQVFDGSSMKFNGAYLYGAWINYDKVEPIALWPEALPDHPLTKAGLGDQIDYTGVHLTYDRFHWNFQNSNLEKVGYQCPTGSSNGGWEQMQMPLNYNQGAPRHTIGIGLGGYWWGRSKGDLYIDNAYVVPFEEITSTTETSITLKDIPEGVKYFAIYAEDLSGNMTYMSPANIGVRASHIKKMIEAKMVSVEEISNIPDRFELEQNYPNPFNPTTSIKFTVPETTTMTLEIFDVLGRKVATLISNEMKSAGTYKAEFDASQYASGVYFYRLSTPNNVKTKKMMLLK